ncbi:MAG: riboflavin biosynthesis protein RibF [Chloroflexota bacterium]|nr:riboflavin biosynthesis protein RibF [Chloroflexota bacterium]
MTSLADLPPIGRAALTMGAFDGVHRGHAALLEATRVAAGSDSSVALVFDPHPDELLRPGIRVPRLAPLAVNLLGIRALGVDHALPLRFDEALRSLSPEEFLEALAPSIELRALAMTPESAFGKGRAGTLERMRQLGSERGFSVVSVDPLAVDDAPVSSSRIRTALADGNLEAACRMLGHPAYLEGTVVRGDRRGRELGFPTANLEFDYVPALPALGIYLGTVAVPDRQVGPGHPALVSVGVRPTFHEDGRVLVEVYLLDWDGDLYGTRLQVELLERLREERRFDRVDALIRQMTLDEMDARRRLGIG